MTDINRVARFETEPKERISGVPVRVFIVCSVEKCQAKLYEMKSLDERVDVTRPYYCADCRAEGWE